MNYMSDGIKASKDGLLITVMGHGIDVLTAYRVQTSFSVVNVAWLSKRGEERWGVGRGEVARIPRELEGRFQSKTGSFAARLLIHHVA